MHFNSKWENNRPGAVRDASEIEITVGYQPFLGSRLTSG